MATETVTLSREAALQVQATLELASEVVVALEWISKQQAETHEMAGALHAVKGCYLRLDEPSARAYEVMHTALMEAVECRPSGDHNARA